MGSRGFRGRGRSRGSFRGKSRGTRGRSNYSNGSRSTQTKKRPNGTTDNTTEFSKKQRLEENVEKVIQPVIESSSDSEEEVKPYSRLLSMFSLNSRPIVSSDSEEETDDEALAKEKDTHSKCDEEEEEVECEEGEEEEEDEEENEEGECEEASVVRDNLDSGALAEEVDSLDEDGELDEEDELEEELDNERIDTFNLHFQRGLSDKLLETLSSPKPYKTSELQWKALGCLSVYLPNIEKTDCKEEKKLILGEMEDHACPGSLPELKAGIPLKDYGVKEQLCENLVKNGLSRNLTAEELLTPLQHELFTLAHEYKDVYYPETNYTNYDEVRTAYCLHVLNHVLKSRDKILSHNTKLKSLKESGKESQEEFRDQGLVRPRVLIVTPMKSSALR